MSTIMQLRSGHEYVDGRPARQFRTNLRFAELLQKALSVDEALGQYNDRRCAAAASPDREYPSDEETDEGSGAWSPTSTSPLSTPTSSPSVQPMGSSEISEDVPPLSEDDEEDEYSDPEPPVPAGDSSKPAKRPSKKCKRAKTASQKESARRRRQEKRHAEQRRVPDWCAPPKQHGATLFPRQEPATIVIDDVDAAVDYQVTKGAYTIRRLKNLSPVPWERLQLEERGFRRFDWDAEETYVILDNAEHVIAVLVGTPLEGADREDDQTWDAATERGAAFFEETRVKAEGILTPKQKEHRRGVFAAIPTGVSYGGGQTIPGNLRHTKGRARILDTLLGHEDIQRIAHWQSDALASYFPKVYAHVSESMAILSASQPGLRRNFRDSVYPTTTFNLGPSTVCLDHNDCGNAPDVPCAVTALGDFDPDAGGELYLWDLALCVRFPPGATILLSSASIRHGNLPTRPGERWYSMTQYCPGGLLRWVHHGLRPASSLTTAQRTCLEGTLAARWREVLGRLSKYEELDDDREWLRGWEQARRAKV